MSVILAKHKLFYASVPKVACTSIKHMFFEFENGRPFTPYIANGQNRNIHNAVYKGLFREKYPEKRIANSHRVALVRDPISRFLSAYSNRVVFHKELSRDKAGPKLKALGLTPNPELDQFIDQLDDYCQAHGSILHHTRPMVDFLGKDPAYFSRLYAFSELSQFVSDMSEHLKTELTLGHKQSGGPKLSRDLLSAAQLQKLEARYKDDFATFKDWL